MTIAGSRFPGSRVAASDHLPRIEKSQWYQMVFGSPLTVAGAAAALLETNAPHSLDEPLRALPLSTMAPASRASQRESRHHGLARAAVTQSGNTNSKLCSIFFRAFAAEVIFVT
jgi:hypothetical protein